MPTSARFRAAQEIRGVRRPHAQHDLAASNALQPRCAWTTQFSSVGERQRGASTQLDALRALAIELRAVKSTLGAAL